MFASRITDMHVCPMVTPGTPPIPHVGGPIIGPPSGKPVLIGGLPAATSGMTCICVGPPDTTNPATATGTRARVFINGLPVICMGDTTIHGGTVIAGLPTVLIGTG